MNSRLAKSLLLGLVLLLGASVAPAQGRPGQHRQPPRDNQANKDRNEQQQDEGRNLVGLPPKWVGRLQELSPEEQQKFLKNNQRFKSLPPDRQAQIRERLNHWNNLSPTERQAMRTREDNLEKMTPEQRDYIRNTLLPKWQQLPEDRKNLIRGRLGVLQSMTPEQRQQKLQDPQFLNGLNPDDRGMLQDLNALRNPPSAPAVPAGPGGSGGSNDEL
jgi:hypothetical protein